MSVLVVSVIALAVTAVCMVTALSVHVGNGSAAARRVAVLLARLIVLESMFLVIVSIVTIVVWIVTR